MTRPIEIAALDEALLSEQEHYTIVRERWRSLLQEHRELLAEIFEIREAYVKSCHDLMRLKGAFKSLGAAPLGYKEPIMPGKNVEKAILFPPDEEAWLAEEDKA